jgi:dUTP pyrophosphatase
LFGVSNGLCYHGLVRVRIKRFDKSLPLPAYTEGAGCFDLICRQTVTIPPHQIKAIPQNVAIEVPDGHVCLLFSRSSTPLRKGIMLANGVGVVDPFYCGDKDEFLAFFHNITDEPITVEAGDKVVQGMFVKPQAIQWQEVSSMNSAGHGGYQHGQHLK